jgi:hypothetical protein
MITDITDSGDALKRFAGPAHYVERLSCVSDVSKSLLFPGLGASHVERVVDVNVVNMSTRDPGHGRAPCARGSDVVAQPSRTI